MKGFDVNEIKKHLSQSDKTFVAVVRVQSPIYVFHLSMMVKDCDPFYPVDWAIVHYIKSQPKPNIGYLAALIGMKSNFVEWRLIHLTMNDSSLDRNLNGSYVITPKGERKYLNEEREEIRKDKQIALDGVTLDFLDELIYKESRVMIRPYKAEFNPHMPLLGDADSHVVSLLSKLEEMDSSQKVKYGFDESAHQFSLRGIEAKCLDDVEVVFSYDRLNSKWSRDLMFNNRPVSIPSMDNLLDQFIFYFREGTLYTNEGYSDATEEITSFYDQDIRAFISKRYDIRPRDIADECYSYTKKPNGSLPISPLCINVTPALFEHAKNRRLLLSDALSGEFLQMVTNGKKNKNDGKRVYKGVFEVPVRHSISEEVNTYKAISEWYEENGGIDYRFVIEYFGEDSRWRDMLLRLHCYEELEEIDNKRFIQE